MTIVNNDIKFIIIDLFCGAGGTTTGFENATVNGKKIAQVIACVNHDKNAIESHAENHPHTLHFFEDIKKVSMLKLKAHVGKHRSISNKLICEAINERPKGFITEDMVKSGFKLTDIRLRKIINHIRNNDIIPMLCSNAKGYYVGSKNEAREYLQSLDERIGAIAHVRKSLAKQLEAA